jgi:hypothetical protein
MRNDPVPDISPDKSPHERFTDLGKQVLSVSMSEIDKRDAAWQKRKRTKPGPKKRR